MKALKYGLTLMLGLSMGLGVQAFAQASGQTQEVVPNNPNTLPEMAPAAEQQVQQAEEQPQRGVPTPKAIEDLLTKGEYAKAEIEFENFIKTAKGNPCDLLYLPYSFYDRLLWENTDTSKISYYQDKIKFYLDKFFKTCPNSVEVYVLKEFRSDPKIPDSTIVRMTKAIDIDPNYAMLYTMRGDALWQLQRTEEACADYAKAKELGDEYATRFFGMNCSTQEAVDNAE